MNCFTGRAQSRREVAQGCARIQTASYDHELMEMVGASRLSSQPSPQGRNSDPTRNTAPTAPHLNDMTRQFILQTSQSTVSKVVDADSKPRVVYHGHGTHADFAAFDKANIRRHSLLGFWMRITLGLSVSNHGTVFNLYLLTKMAY